MKLIKIVVLFFAISVQGCSSSVSIEQQVAESILFQTVGIGLSHGESSCKLLANRCTKHGYSEWQDENGKIHCSCNDD